MKLLYAVCLIPACLLSQTSSYVVLNGNTSAGLEQVSTDGRTVKVISATASGADLAIDSAGNFILAAVGSLERVTPAGAITTIAVAPYGADWVSVTLDSAGNFILGDNRKHTIWRVGPAGSPMVPVASYTVGNTNEAEDIKILVDSHGNYMVTEDNDFSLHWFTVTPGGSLTPFNLTGSDIPSGVGGLTFDAAGNYMVLDYRKHALYRVTPAGASTLVVHSDSQLCCNAVGLSRNAATGEYISALNFGQKLQKISADGQTITTLASGAANFSFPESVAVYTAPGAPIITGVANGATFNPGAAISTGSWTTIFGQNLAPPGDSRTWNKSTEVVAGKLPLSLDGTSVSVNGKPAVVEFISPSQVNIQTPDDTALGPVQVMLTTAAGVSNAFTTLYQSIAPGLFPATAPYLAAQHADFSFVTSAAPAKPGELITLWGTGFGPATPPVAAGQVFTGASPLVNTVTAMIGGQPAVVEYAGVVGAGLVQINVYVPTGLGNSDFPVVLTALGVSTQATANFLTIHN